MRDIKKARAKSLRWYEQHKEQENARRRAHLKNNPTLVTANNRKRRTGWTQAEYDAAYVAQNGRCATCGKHQDELTCVLNADHCHKTKRKRGLLCRRCNFVLGFVNDSIELLLAYIGYLNKYQ